MIFIKKIIMAFKAKYSKTDAEIKHDKIQAEINSWISKIIWDIDKRTRFLTYTKEEIHYIELQNIRIFIQNFYKNFTKNWDKLNLYLFDFPYKNDILK